MALLKIKQLRSNLSYNTTTNVLRVSGSLQTAQTNSSNPSLASGSYNGEPIDGGTF